MMFVSVQDVSKVARVVQVVVVEEQTRLARREMTIVTTYIRTCSQPAFKIANIVETDRCGQIQKLAGEPIGVSEDEFDVPIVHRAEQLKTCFTQEHHRQSCFFEARVLALSRVGPWLIDSGEDL